MISSVTSQRIKWHQIYTSEAAQYKTGGGKEGAGAGGDMDRDGEVISERRKTDTLLELAKGVDVRNRKV